MRLPIPDPRDALALAAGGPALVAQLAGALPRVLDLLDDAEALVKRAHRLVDDIDQTRQDADEVVKRTDQTIESANAVIARITETADSADGVIGRINETADRADGVIGRINETADRADGVIGRIGETIDSANAVIARTAGTVGSVEPTLERAEQLLDGFAPSLEKMQPMVERLASTTDVKEIDAIIEMIDQTPVLMKRLETDVLPMMAGLGTVAPDIHDMLDLIEELNEMLAKVPGLGRVKRRIDEEQAAEAAAAEQLAMSQDSSDRSG